MHTVNTSPVGESSNSSNTVESTSEEKTTPAEQKTDDRYNYATARLNFGMSVFNFDDAVKEGDGERILRCWKFFMLIFRDYNTLNMHSLHCSYSSFQHAFYPKDFLICLNGIEQLIIINEERGTISPWI